LALWLSQRLMVTGSQPAFGPEEFGQNLRRLRLERSLTQEAVAEHAAVSPRYVALIEAGARNPTLSVIIGLADALGVHPSRLFKL
jgi:transcriptional regulator with XRE-family HTH domain